MAVEWNRKYPPLSTGECNSKFGVCGGETSNVRNVSCDGLEVKQDPFCVVLSVRSSFIVSCDYSVMCRHELTSSFVYYPRSHRESECSAFVSVYLSVCTQKLLLVLTRFFMREGIYSWLDSKVFWIWTQRNY